MSLLLAPNQKSIFDDNVDQAFAHACYTGNVPEVLHALASPHARTRLLSVKSTSAIDQSTDYYVRLCAYAIWRSRVVSIEHMIILDALLAWRGPSGEFFDLQHSALPATSVASIMSRFFAPDTGAFHMLAHEEFPPNPEGAAAVMRNFSDTRYAPNPYIDISEEFERGATTRHDADFNSIDENVIVYHESFLPYNRFDVLCTSPFVLHTALKWRNGALIFDLNEQPYTIAAARGDADVVKYMQLVKPSLTSSDLVYNTLKNFIVANQGARWYFLHQDRASLFNRWINTMNLLGARMPPYKKDGVHWPPPTPPPTPQFSSDDEMDSFDMDYY